MASPGKGSVSTCFGIGGWRHASAVKSMVSTSFHRSGSPRDFETHFHATMATASDTQALLARLWPRYFEGEASPSPEDRRMNLAASLARLFESEADLVVPREAIRDGRCVLPLNQRELCAKASCADLVAALELQPEEALCCIALGAHVSRLRRVPKAKHADAMVLARLVMDQRRPTPIRTIKSNAIGKLVSIKGTVVRLGPQRTMLRRSAFACSSCGAHSQVTFLDGKYKTPTRCVTGGCRGRTFEIVHESAESVDWQKMRLQELLSSDNTEEARIPRTIDVELTDDLVDCCTPGDVLTVSGIVKVINTTGDGGKGRNNNQSLYFLYLEAVAVVKSRTEKSPQEQERNVELGISGYAHPDGVQNADVLPPNMPAFTEKDLEFVIKFHAECSAGIFRHLVQSVCPAIYGHELVKAGLLLALFGGVRKHSNDRNKVPVRGDIHVLVVGDPGLGKSQMLQAVSSIAPRGLYVCGNTSTSAGLTVSVMKDATSGDFTFEAGAVVLGDRGVCCVDEFDKMTSEHQALLEVMEQQAVSVAKAGLVATLPARTSVIAAANPVGGHYNRAKTVNENLKISSAMLSRFDLIFILLDKPDEVLDQHLSEHVMALHSGSAARSEQARRNLLGYHAGHLALPGTNEQDIQRIPISAMLRVPLGQSDLPALPNQLLRKYIAYARKYCNPILSEKAKDVLRQFYLTLRERAQRSDGTPITARQLESLVRLAEARARMELREVVTEQDALDVVDIMKESLFDKLTDENGYIDFRRAGGKSKQAEAKRFLGALNRKTMQLQKAILTTSELYEVADDIELRVESLIDFFESLNDAGELLKKGPGLWLVQCSDYAGSQSRLSKRSRSGSY